MKTTMRTMAVLVAMLGAAVAPRVSRADDDDGDSAPKSDDGDDESNEIGRSRSLFTAEDSYDKAYVYQSTGKYRRGDAIVTSRLTFDGCAKPPTTYSIAIESTSGGSASKDREVGKTVQFTAPVEGQITITISADTDCKLTLKASGRYEPKARLDPK